MNRNFIFAAVAGVLVLTLIFRRDILAAGSATSEFLTNPNEGTPFEGTGIIGIPGRGADIASGGLLSRFGSFLGEFVTRFTDTRTVDDLTGGTFVGPPEL